MRAAALPPVCAHKLLPNSLRLAEKSIYARHLRQHHLGESSDGDGMGGWYDIG